MAHFAKVSPQGIVEQVVVISNSDLLDENGVEQEPLGVGLCQSIFGGGLWVQTSFNGNFNGEFAQPGFVYSAEHHVFRSPEPPYPSWSINPETGLWESPVPKPTSEYVLAWDEETQTWIEHKPEEIYIDGERYFRHGPDSEWLVLDERQMLMVPAENQEQLPQ